MTHLFLRFLLAPDANDDAGGNDQQPVKQGVSDIIDDFEIPASAGRGGQRGSKYMTDEIAAKVEKLQPKQGIVIPFMGTEERGNKDGNVTPKRQRYATRWRVDEWAKTQEVKEEKDGDKVIKAGVPMPKFTVVIIKDKGIAVRRDS